MQYTEHGRLIDDLRSIIELSSLDLRAEFAHSILVLDLAFVRVVLEENAKEENVG